MNQQLLKDLNALRKERGMRVVELNGFSDQVNALTKNSQLGRRAEDDLELVVHLIDEGVKEGVLKVGVVKTGMLNYSNCGLIVFN